MPSGWKKVLLAIIAMAFMLSSVAKGLAYPSDLKVLTKEEIAKLTDEELTEHYIDVIVELEASRQFHTTSGFLPKEYDEFKGLMRYKVYLKMEIHKRELKLPDIEY